jgi:hypothetical protein
VYLQNYYEIMLYSYHCQCQSFGATESRSFETRRNNGLASAGAGGVGQASASARFAALANFLITRSRLSLEMWSMNSTMIDLVLQARCEQPVRLDFALGAVPVSKRAAPQIRSAPKKPNSI